MSVKQASASNLKTVRRIIPAQRKHWVGNGFNVFPVFGSLAFTNELSPWLMFDYAAPKEFGPTSQRRGVGQHPHRGFETVTIAFQGAVEHSDSVGHNDVIGPGDVQWMTAGRGIIHEEYHSTDFAKTGGVFEMCQLWVNLPKKDKMVAPRYQPIVAGDIPRVPLLAATEADGSCGGESVGEARIVAGELHGTRGPAATFSPVELFDLELRAADTPVELPVPAGHNTVVFVRSGEISVEGQTVGAQGVALMSRSGEKLRLSARVPNSQVLLLGGEPLDEPIAAQGPFVMNTQAEIRQAMADFNSGRMGS